MECSVELRSSDGTTERIETPVLLGADGLHSAVRSRMFPGEGDPRWGGAVLWRGSAPGPPLRDGASFLVVGNTNQRFVTFPISEPNPRTGLQLHNWIAELRFDPSRGWRRGDWNTRVEVDEFIADFEDWNFEWLDIPALIRRSEVVYEYPMVDRDPVDHWVHGSVALIGDAAHPMYPVGSNGASQAIVDARVLGAAFVEHGVGRDALHAYESALLSEMSALLLRNRGSGPVSVLGMIDEQRGSRVRRCRNDLARRGRAVHHRLQNGDGDRHGTVERSATHDRSRRTGPTVPDSAARDAGQTLGGTLLANSRSMSSVVSGICSLPTISADGILPRRLKSYDSSWRAANFVKNR